MTIRRILFGALAASIALTSAAAAGPDASSVPPPVGRIARELAVDGARKVIVFASVGDKSYVATAGTRRPKPDQRFRVGSVTKTFTATILLQLVDEGKLSLTSTLEDHLPGVVTRGNEITMRQLLQHRSGLANFTDYPSWYEAASRSPSTRPIDSLRFAASKPLLFDPGTRWSYSNTNYIALGLVVEQVTGRSYAQELEQRILQPLGLDHTELAETRRLPDLDDEGENPNLPWAAGSIVSNGRDIARFYSALLKARIVSATSLAVMKRAVEVGPDTRYGLGVFSIGARCGRAWGHYGGILDYATTAFASESGERVGVISIYGRPPFLQADLGILVCPNYRLAKSAATSKIAFSTGRDVRAVNADGSRQRRLAPGTDPAWSPDGQSIAFVTGRHLYAMNADGSRRRRLVTGGDPAWSRDGRKIAFFRSGGVYVMNADGSRQRKLAHGSSPAWSPDGRTISFLRRGDIYVMDAGGGGQRNLTRDAAPDTDPAWSPDGRRIAFARKIAFPGGVGGSFEIFVMNADGSGQRRLTRDAARDDAPDWSPDGRRIVFERGVGAGGGGHEAGWFVIAVVSADGSGQPKELSRGEPLVDQGAPRAARPLWSPDGRMIAYLSWRHGNYDVYVMNADGSGLTNVTRSKASESSFAWSPVRSK